MKKSENPILAKLNRLVMSNATTYEKISVCLDVSFYTLRSWFYRGRLPRSAAKAFLTAKLILKEEYDAERVWSEKYSRKHGKPQKRHSKPSGDDSKAKRVFGEGDRGGFEMGGSVPSPGENTDIS